MSENFGDIFKEWESKNKIVDKDSQSAKLKNIVPKNEKNDLSIDLHGLTKNEALTKLCDFVRRNQSGQVTKIIVIHGVGRHSEGKRVLKEAVKEWLSINDNLIRNFRPAGIGEGSGGATVAFIKPK